MLCSHRFICSSPDPWRSVPFPGHVPRTLSIVRWRNRGFESLRDSLRSYNLEVPKLGGEQGCPTRSFVLEWRPRKTGWYWDPGLCSSSFPARKLLGFGTTVGQTSSLPCGWPGRLSVDNITTHKMHVYFWKPYFLTLKKKSVTYTLLKKDFSRHCQPSNS